MDAGKSILLIEQKIDEAIQEKTLSETKVSRLLTFAQETAYESVITRHVSIYEQIKKTLKDTRENQTKTYISAPKTPQNDWNQFFNSISQKFQIKWVEGTNVASFFEWFDNNEVERVMPVHRVFVMFTDGEFIEPPNVGIKLLYESKIRAAIENIAQTRRVFEKNLDVHFYVVPLAYDNMVNRPVLHDEQLAMIGKVFHNTSNLIADITKKIACRP